MKKTFLTILKRDRERGEKIMKDNKLIGVVMALLLLLGACGGGGGGAGGTTVTGLEIADEVSLVDAQDVASPSVNVNGFKSLALKALTADTTTAYYTDPLDVWVFDDSMESLNIINEILCSFGQTRYAEMVNQGDYIALINKTACDMSSDKSSSSTNESTGADATEYEAWVLNSSRADSSSNQIVMAWIDREASEYEPAMMIHAKTTIYEASTESNPFGRFHIDIMMMDPTETTAYAQGYLETVDRDDGQIEIQFSMQGLVDLFPVDEAVHLVSSADRSSGYAYAAHNWGGESKAYNVAFNEQYYLAGDVAGESSRCLDRLNPTNHVFRYGVYKEDGSRLSIANPGFGIKYSSGGIDYYGFAGYYGIWMPEEAGLTSGLTVMRANGDASSGQEYTTIVIPGRFIKHTKEEITLRDIKGAYLNYWDNMTFEQSRVVWDGTNFVKDAVFSCSDSGCSWTVQAEENLTFNPGEWVGFWREGYGDLFFEVPDPMTDASPITYNKMEVLNPAADDFAGGAMTLYCYNQCLRPNISSEQINWENGNSPYFDMSVDVANPYVYAIDPADMTLKYGGQEVKVQDGVVAIGQNQWGVNSGDMVASVAGFNAVWDVYGQTVTYTWETGPNSWNKYTGLVDSGGTAVSFDAPTNLLYTHTNDVKYVLQFAGWGELQGIPWHQVVGTDRWYPEFSIPDGSSAVSDAGTTYYIRALEMEQQMLLVDEGSCNVLSAETLEAPAETYADPDIGNKPTVTGDPAVIGGELVGS